MLKFKLFFIFLFIILVIEAKTNRQNKYNTKKNYNLQFHNNASSLSIEKNSKAEYFAKNFHKKEPVSKIKKGRKIPGARRFKTPKSAENTMLGCRRSGLCCQGKNNNCITKGPRMNGKNNNTCYCDASCLPLKDCCIDYTDHCKGL